MLENGRDFPGNESPLRAVPPYAFLLGLADALCDLAEPLEIMRQACARLGQFLGAGQVSYGEIDREGGVAAAATEWNDGSIASAAGDSFARSFGAFNRELKRGEIVVDGERALMLVPVLETGDLVAVLAVTSTMQRAWSAEAVEAARETAERTHAALLRARAANAVRESEGRLRRIFEAIDEGYCVCEIIVDGEGEPCDYRFIEVNPLFEKMTGLSDAAGRTARELVPDLEALWWEKFGRVALAGETLRFESYSPALGRSFDVLAMPLEIPGRFAVAFKDTTARRLAEEKLRNSHDTYLTLIENSPLGVYLVDSDFRLAQISVGTRKVFQGIDPLLGRDFAEIMHIIWTEPHASEFIGRFRHTLATGETYHSADTSATRNNIDAVEAYDWQIERVTLPDGRLGVVCYFYDMTERRHYENRVRLLMHEVNHRSKNLLSVVQSVARYTAAGNVEDFVQRFQARVQGLAVGQDLLIRGQWHSVLLKDLVRLQLAHFEDLIGTRIRIDGPPVNIGAAAAQTIGMALHELSTNALKYGALSIGAGSIEINWSLKPTADGGQLLAFSWVEKDGPPVKPPERRGFGSIVIEGMMKAGLEAEVRLDFEPDGLKWRFETALIHQPSG